HAGNMEPQGSLYIGNPEVPCQPKCAGKDTQTETRAGQADRRWRDEPGIRKMRFSPRRTEGAPMPKITPTLWYDGTAEEAANFYVSLLPDSRIEAVNRSPIDTPSGPAGMVITVIFTLAGQRFCGLN